MPLTGSILCAMFEFIRCVVRTIDKTNFASELRNNLLCKIGFVFVIFNSNYDFVLFAFVKQDAQVKLITMQSTHYHNVQPSHQAVRTA